MKSIVIATALLLTGFTSLHAAPSVPTEFLKLFDLDRDGVLNEEERPAARKALSKGRAEFIARWDTNKDGKLSLAEVRVLRRAIISHIMAMRRSIFIEFAGTDELMSQEELASMPIFAEKDPSMIEEIFNRLDRDESGLLSFLEFNARFRRYPI
jgi:Ca2+-binding EF-hand superfamily protein